MFAIKLSLICLLALFQLALSEIRSIKLFLEPVVRMNEEAENLALTKHRRMRWKKRFETDD